MATGIAEGQTGRETSLSPWVGEYVTDMLGRGHAAASQPYTAYTGPLTAGVSDLQQQAYTGADGTGGLASLTTPEGMGAYTPTSFTANLATPQPAPSPAGIAGVKQPYQPAGLLSPEATVAEARSRWAQQGEADDISDAEWERASYRHPQPGAESYRLGPEGERDAAIRKISDRLNTERYRRQMEDPKWRAENLNQSTRGTSVVRSEAEAKRHEEAETRRYQEQWARNDLPEQPTSSADQARMAFDLSQPLDDPLKSAVADPMEAAGDTGQLNTVAEQYMNPYLQSSLRPQIDELRRQQEISRLGDANRLTQAGAYGGSRQAIMEAEGNRNLLSQIDRTQSAGYKDAYDKARAQFNVEQAAKREAQIDSNRYGFDVLAAQERAGATQRGITGEGIAADYQQFMQERDYPLKSAQYMQSLLQELPLEAQSYQYAPLDPLQAGISGAASTAGHVAKILELFGIKI